MELAKEVPPHQGKTATSAEKVGSFADAWKGEIAGELRVCERRWIGVRPKAYVNRSFLV